MMFGPEIMGKLVKLAPMDESMAETFLSYINDPETNRFRPAPPVESVEAEREWVRNIGKSEQDVVWAIYYLEDGEWLDFYLLECMREDWELVRTSSI